MEDRSAGLSVHDTVGSQFGSRIWKSIQLWVVLAEYYEYANKKDNENAYIINEKSSALGYDGR